MSCDTLQLTPELYDYLYKVSLREPQVLRDCRIETAQHPRAAMQISPEQGQFMSLLVKLLDVRKVIEIGVFTGYSSISMALAMADDGQIDACDINEDFTSIARKYWKAAGVEKKIKLHLAPALETIEQFKNEGKSSSYDFAFIDADKANYMHYYEGCLELIRPGGLILVDNVLWDGDVADPSIDDPDTEGIRKLNLNLHQDERVDISMLPVGDGLTLARKR